MSHSTHHPIFFHRQLSRGLDVVRSQPNHRPAARISEVATQSS